MAFDRTKHGVLTDAADLTPAQAKILNTIRAEFALHGYEVHELPDGAGFLIDRRGVTRHCATLNQLQAQARRMGVVR